MTCFITQPVNTIDYNKFYFVNWLNSQNSNYIIYRELSFTINTAIKAPFFNIEIIVSSFNKYTVI